MRFLNRAAVSTALSVLLTLPFVAPARAQDWPQPDKATVQAYILERAAYHGAPARLTLDIAECESHFDPSAWNPRSGATGVFQWVRGGAWNNTPYWTQLGISIWDEYAAGNPGAWLADVDAGTWAIAHGLRGHWQC